MSEERELFLEKSDATLDCPCQSSRLPLQRLRGGSSWIRRYALVILCHGLVITFYLTVWTNWAFRGHCGDGKRCGAIEGTLGFPDELFYLERQATHRPTAFTRDAVRYEERVFEVNPKLADSSARIYAGQPSPELDDAWNYLLRCIIPSSQRRDGNSNDIADTSIRVPLDEMIRLGREDQGVRFTDGSGYFGSLAVYHSLHCVVSVHNQKRKPKV